jgi:hypothetical protein
MSLDKRHESIGERASTPATRLRTMLILIDDNTKSLHKCLASCLFQNFSNEDLYCRAKEAVLGSKKFSLKGKQVDVFNHTMDKANNNEQVLMLIHGKWGTGKTRTTNAILDGLKRIGIHAKCTGPTGVAATNYAGGMTSHALFGIGRTTPTLIERLTDHMKKVVNRLGKATFLVCDEVSMYSPTLINQMDTILKLALHNNKPFGGLSVIFVGDFHQKTLPGNTPVNHALCYHAMQKNHKDVDKAAAMLLEKFQKFELESGAHCRQKCKVLTPILDALRNEEYATAWYIFIGNLRQQSQYFELETWTPR